MKLLILFVDALLALLEHSLVIELKNVYLVLLVIGQNQDLLSVSLVLLDTF